MYPGELGDWFQADKITAAIGQSDNRFSPIQLCVYASTLANRGTRLRATFLNRVVSSDYRNLLYENETTVLNTYQISDDAYKAYSEGMNLVTIKTADWTGTAYSTFKDYPIPLAAKTGTAQSGGDNPDHGAFVCYAPLENPRIAISIYGEKAAHGRSLAPIARAMMDSYFDVGEVGDVVTYENKLS